MSLRRSAAGLTSLHLFFKVDVVVYCEGGTDISAADVLAGHGQEETLDVLFWMRVAEFLGATRKYHFKSVGSKLTLKSIAQDIQAGDVASIIVCLDRDFDWHCGREIVQKNVVYTHGYSWENDVSFPLAIEGVFFRLVGRNPESDALFQQAENYTPFTSQPENPWG
jgi:hypothetical protein